MNSERCEVLIVGGGPAGASCARALTRAGLDVMIMDKSAFPRDKVCAGWVTPPVLETLQIDPAEYAQQATLQPISSFRVGFIDGEARDADYPEVVSYGIRRCEFDHYLLQRAGARRVLNESLRALTRVDGHWRVNDHVDAKLLIGAGGHFCPVARYLGADVGSSEIAVKAREIELPLSAAQQAQCAVAAHRPELYFCPDLQGYGWIFRKGDYLNIGLGREDSQRLSEHSAAFMTWLKTIGRIPEDLPDAFKGHAYLLYSHGQRKLFDDAVLLIGDAAGLAYPQSGEGIRPAVESGLLAAATVIAANGDYRAASLAPYRQRLNERFGTAGSDFAQYLPGPLRQFLATRLLNTAWFARHVVLDRWFLHRQQAPLRAIA